MREENSRVLVIGAGVSGLTCAVSLARAGYGVTVLAEKFAPAIVSVVAGALWEWPPAVCGYHDDLVSLSRSKSWCMTSFERFAEMAAAGVPGVHMRTANFYFTAALDDIPGARKKMIEIQALVPGFAVGRTSESERVVSAAFGVVDAYRHDAPMIDTGVYMQWLHLEAKRLGVSIVARRVEGSLENQADELLERYAADAIVCCAGLGTAELRNTDMYPLRGALIRVVNDGAAFPRVTEAHCVSHVDGSNEQDIVFIVPRGADKLVLGGLAQEDRWDTDLTLDDLDVKAMLERCIRFMPQLADAIIDHIEPVRTGLRPFRKGNVCLEQADGRPLVYNYGHGGAGFSFSWGCAEEVVGLVDAMTSARDMATA